MNLRIEEPCHENWNLMTPQEKGRHCDKCCKTVFDFTQMPTEEVIQFIASRKKDSVCGRFTAEQVQVPSPVRVSPKISWTFKKFLAALFLVFGGALFTGCGNETMGEMIVVDTPVQQMGVTIAEPDTVIPKTNAKDTAPSKKDPEEKMLKGKVSCEPNPKEEVYYNGGVTLHEPEIVGLVAMELPPLDTNRVPPADTLK